MIVGKKTEFAIEFEVMDRVDGWKLGSLIFWVKGVSIGDAADLTVDLNGCFNWIKEFLEVECDRYEQELFYAEKKQVYIRLCSSVLEEEGNQFAEEKYTQSYSRFHISHMGMSSFDQVVLILLQNLNDDSRLIWSQQGNSLKEACISTLQFQNVLKDAVLLFSAESI